MSPRIGQPVRIIVAPANAPGMRNVRGVVTAQGASKTGLKVYGHDGTHYLRTASLKVVPRFPKGERKS